MTKIASLAELYSWWMYDALWVRILEGNFFNFGLWEPKTRNHQEAAENLVLRLIESCTPHSDSILDVACGKGATTRLIWEKLQPPLLMGINISEKQIGTCRATCPQGRFQVMDAARLQFTDGEFDNVVCVEAAFHFHTREEFIKESFRVLKPGGRLTLSDVLITPANTTLIDRSDIHPMSNAIDSVEQYLAIYERAGFKNVEIEEITSPVMDSFSRHARNVTEQVFLAGEIGAEKYTHTAAWIALMQATLRPYVLVSAEKPQS